MPENNKENEKCVSSEENSEGSELMAEPSVSPKDLLQLYPAEEKTFGRLSL